MRSTWLVIPARIMHWLHTSSGTSRTVALPPYLISVGLRVRAKARAKARTKARARARGLGLGND